MSAPATIRAAQRIADPAERALFIACMDAGDEYDCACDGAYHHAYPREVADARYYAARREYDRAARALITYRRVNTVDSAS
jgi:hypothetical protein